ncbi:hypothetical protein C8R45DRAFT_1110808 [Mycena sanguinolenta]|nr:hypothetical protein C8R45DRAFT_1110808 [Mycena sanguinolenta]
MFGWLTPHRISATPRIPNEDAINDLTPVTRRHSPSSALCHQAPSVFLLPIVLLVPILAAPSRFVVPTPEAFAFLQSNKPQIGRYSYASYAPFLSEIAPANRLIRMPMKLWVRRGTTVATVTQQKTATIKIFTVQGSV